MATREPVEVGTAPVNLTEDLDPGEYFGFVERGSPPVRMFDGAAAPTMGTDGFFEYVPGNQILITKKADEGHLRLDGQRHRQVGDKRWVIDLGISALEVVVPEVFMSPSKML